MSTILEVKKVKKQFGPLVAINEIDLSIETSKVTGLIGPNGSGKTTLFNLLSGYFAPCEGSIYFQGTDITNLTPVERVDLGISRSFQIVSIFPNMALYENLVLPVLRYHEDLKKGWKFYFSNIAGNNIVMDECEQLLKMVNLEDKLKVPVCELSYGDQRLLDIILSISLKPKVLLLDEPFSGLGDMEISIILDLLSNIKNDFTLFIIEHKLTKLEGLVDKLIVLSEGEVVCQGKPKEVLCDPEVRRCYWGDEH